MDKLLEIVSAVTVRIQLELGHPNHMEAAMRAWLRRLHYMAERGRRCEPPSEWTPKALPWLTAGSAARSVGG
jgi:hypothetical protein